MVTQSSEGIHVLDPQVGTIRTGHVGLAGHIRPRERVRTGNKGNAVYALVHTKGITGIPLDDIVLEQSGIIRAPEHGYSHYSIRNRVGDPVAPSVQARHGRCIRRIEKRGSDILSDVAKGKVVQIARINIPGETPFP